MLYDRFDESACDPATDWLSSRKTNKQTNKNIVILIITHFKIIFTLLYQGIIYISNGHKKTLSFYF